MVARLSGPAPAPAPTPGIKPFGGETPGSGTNVPGPVTYPTGYGFTGTPDQSGTAAYLAGLPNNSPQWVAEQTASNANGGVLPGIGGSGSNPYASDPGYAAALAQEKLGYSQNEAALNNLIQQRIIAYGDPALAGMAGFGLDPQAAAFARQNYLAGNAELARIDRQHKLNLQAIINRLAGHGLLFSGDTGYQSGQEDQGYGNTVYDAQQRALADILGYRQNTLNQEQALHQSTIQALQQAYQNFLQHPELGGYGQPDTTPTEPTTSSSLAAALKRFATAQRKSNDVYGL